MTAEELANISGIKVETVKKKISTIAGYDSESKTIPDGSRWKYNFRNSSLKNTDDRRYHMLKATDEYRYIDHNMLRMSKQSFDRMIAELVACNLIEKNGSDNYYGANQYDTTIIYSKYRYYDKRKTIKFIVECIGIVGSEIVNRQQL